MNFDGSASIGSTFDWDFDDGSSPSSQASPSHTYSNIGSYQVKLTMISGNCSDTDSVKVVVVNTTSIEEHGKKAPHFRVTPNPATDGSTNVVLDELTQEGTLEVRDLNGRLVRQQTLQDAQRVNLDLNGLDAGVYLIKVSARQGVTTSKLTIER